jgi:hypothetical protein
VGEDVAGGGDPVEVLVGGQQCVVDDAGDRDAHQSDQPRRAGEPLPSAWAPRERCAHRDDDEVGLDREVAQLVDDASGHGREPRIGRGGRVRELDRQCHCGDECVGRELPCQHRRAVFGDDPGGSARPMSPTAGSRHSAFATATTKFDSP